MHSGRFIPPKVVTQPAERSHQRSTNSQGIEPVTVKTPSFDLTPSWLLQKTLTKPNIGSVAAVPKITGTVDAKPKITPIRAQVNTPQNNVPPATIKPEKVAASHTKAGKEVKKIEEAEKASDEDEEDPEDLETGEDVMDDGDTGDELDFVVRYITFTFKQPFTTNTRSRLNKTAVHSKRAHTTSMQ